jgi:two-component system LytT family response regulator
VKRGNTHYFVPVEQVDWIDVADNYLQLHVGGRVHLHRGTMKQAEDELDPARFVRVHRSAMVAIDKIKAIRSHPVGGHVLELLDGSQLRTSRQYADRVRALIR